MLGTFALWYGWYVRERREELMGRNLRLVEAFGVHMGQSLSATRRALDRLIDDEDNGKLEKVDPPDAPLVARLRAMFRDRSFTAIQVGPAPAREEAAPEPPVKESETTSETASRKSRSRTGAIDISITAPPILELKRKLKGPTPRQAVTVKVDLSQLLKRERANDADGQPVFADIVLMERNGRVIAQRDAPGGQLFWLPAPDNTPDEGFERVTSFEALNERFYLFRQVIAVDEQEMVVCGMVPVERFDEVARWLSSSKQLLLGLIVLLATLALPFLRILFDPDRSVPFRDLAFAGVAGIATVAVLTLVIVDLPMYRSELLDKTDRELRGLMTELHRRFLQELNTVGGALEGVPPDAVVADCESHGDLFSQPAFAPLKKSYPFVSELSLIGPEDKQITKWTRDRVASPLRDAGDRAFVRDFRNGRAWTVQGRTLVAQHLRSKVRGTKETVVCISQPSTQRARPPCPRLQHRLRYRSGKSARRRRRDDLGQRPDPSAGLRVRDLRSRRRRHVPLDGRALDRREPLRRGRRAPPLSLHDGP